ncbi:hypothetical protein HDV01_003501 [Terramyces sp. JEL0728]|nr:hypothetical protein HDV01_003501 [Terramyces sp. JEL0728]
MSTKTTPALLQSFPISENSTPDSTPQGSSTDLHEDQVQLLISDRASVCPSHAEPHFGSAEVIRDVIVGLSDGLTVPFALAAGLATLDSSRIVLTAGVAEVVAGSISMALGGFLAGLSEIEHYDSERKRELLEVEEMPDKETQEIYDIFHPYGINDEQLEPLLNRLHSDKEVWVDFMMKFELGLERPDPNRSWISALTIGASYFCGGVVPLVPYALIPHSRTALSVSAIVTIIALFIFGYIKSILLGNRRPFVGAFQMMFIGALAAGAAFGIANLLPKP